MPFFITGDNNLFLKQVLPDTFLEKHLRLKPNQGVWASGKNSLLITFSLSTVAFISATFFRLLLHNDFLPILALIAVPLFFTAFGGAAFLQHFLVRFFLWRMKYLPWNVVAFLHEAVERLFLRKVGGGYVFSHRLILDYFAQANTLPLPQGDPVTQALLEKLKGGELAWRCENVQKSRVRGQVLIAQEHQPLPAEPRLARFRASGSPRATTILV